MNDDGRHPGDAIDPDLGVRVRDFNVYDAYWDAVAVIAAEHPRPLTPEEQAEVNEIYARMRGLMTKDPADVRAEREREKAARAAARAARPAEPDLSPVLVPLHVRKVCHDLRRGARDPDALAILRAWEHGICVPRVVKEFTALDEARFRRARARLLLSAADLLPEDVRPFVLAELEAD